MSCRSFPVQLLIAFAALNAPAFGVDRDEVTSSLQHREIDVDLPLKEVRIFTESLVRRFSPGDSLEEWEQQNETNRQQVLENVVFRGEAKLWRDAETRVEWLERIPGGPGYSIRKLRYEAIPNVWIPALLYEPDELSDKAPVILNVNGHDSKGKAADYKQIRCINQAKRGMLALNVEWIGMGQLKSNGFSHYRSNQIDLCGTSGLAIHYLTLSRAVDLLLEHPRADPERVAVTGLSGGGWQTIFFSALDPRITLSNPVAGYSSYRTRAVHVSDLGDSEQTPVDLAMIADYTHLTAMRAPRPTLLTFNALDQCCFKADHALEPLQEAALPVYELYGQKQNLRTHVNHDPGTHNFERENREQLYSMLNTHFLNDDRPESAQEIDFENELKTSDELFVPLPEQTDDFHSIAMKLQSQLPRESAREDFSLNELRSKLRELLRLEVIDAERVQSSPLPTESISSTGHRIRVDHYWTLPATELTPHEETEAFTIVIADDGRAEASEEVAKQLEAGRRVLAVDLFSHGESTISQRDFLYGLLVSSVGQRPLGIQVAQLLSIVEMHREESESPIELLALGPKSGLIVLLAAALHPEYFDRVEIVDGFSSLKEIFTRDLQIPDGPELFCFGLLESFDIPVFREMAEPVNIVNKRSSAD
ncbi:Alpha/beta hydrolase family protein [Thalassoglobus neptunius]|uniref:Alpha/beta hydrolase family protein n=1 Tax=Thalassoglobus neptunius TaxID=1938619 RepID=A0A5C5X8F0_9PLAN|nr:acetylxylan esterase [Thalassoglobus neptunius]TWT59118.1 Alpha/beta hydrolase family protein [Thalassoglobus neptunius]